MKNILLKSSMSGFSFLIIGVENFNINEFLALEENEMMDYIHTRKGKIFDLDLCKYSLEELLEMHNIKTYETIIERF